MTIRSEVQEFPLWTHHAGDRSTYEFTSV